MLSVGVLVPVIGRANRGRANDLSAATLVSATPAGTLGSGEIWPKSREFLLYILRYVRILNCMQLVPSFCM